MNIEKNFVDPKSESQNDQLLELPSNDNINNKELLNASVEVFKAYWSNSDSSNNELSHIREVLYTIKGFVNEVFKSNTSSHRPAVKIEDSVQDDHIICLEDGKPLKMLKRYLKNHYGMSIEAYKAKWSLPDDYPVVAPMYSKVRQKLAVDTGLGYSRKAKKTS